MIQAPVPAAVKPFDDERSRLSEELAFEAERAFRAGNVAESKVLFTQAAELEEKVARTSTGNVRNALASSAAALWVKAGKSDEAKRVAAEFDVEVE